MRVFVTGSTGFVGSAIVQELLSTGHQVLGLARSQAAISSLIAAGAQAHLGSLEDLDSLRSGAAVCDAAIHTAFGLDLAHLEINSKAEQHAIEALGMTFNGSERSLLVTSGVAFLKPGRVATEEDLRPASSPSPRAVETTATSLIANGVHASIVRLAAVHGEGDHSFIPTLMKIAREKAVSAYVGDGTNRCPAVHRSDVARLYRLALESTLTGMTYHAVAEEGVLFKEIADVIGRQLGVPVVSLSPEQAKSHFGDFIFYAASDVPASSERTRTLLSWKPERLGLIADISRPDYFNPWPPS